MASLTKKKIGRHTYYYVRECQRVDGRPKIVRQKYLGRLEKIVAAVSEQRQGYPVPVPQDEGMVTQLGAVAALYDLARRLDLVGIIDRHVPKRGSGPSVGTYLMIGALNRCVDPSSKAALGRWFDQTILPRLLPVQSRQLSSQRYWDNMDRVDQPAIGAIEMELAQKVVQEFGLELSRLLFDGTNFFTFIDSFNDKCQLAQRGRSKQGRAALRLIGLALLVSTDFHVPLFHHTYAGNQNDARTFSEVSAELVRRCRALSHKVGHITLIFDKGNNSYQNLEKVSQGPFHFVGSLVPTQHAELLQVPREHFRSLAGQGLPGVRAYRCQREVLGEQRTVVVLYNENLFVSQSKTLLREISKRQKRLHSLLQQLERWRRGEVTRGRAPTLEGTRKKVQRWLKARHMKDLFAVEVVQQQNLPRLSYEFVASAWEHLQATLLGKTILFTDNDDWTEAEIVKAYRSQYHIEDAFRSLKDPHHIALRPQFHWTDQKIRVHVFICVIALMLVSLLRRELAGKGLHLSIRRMLKLLGEIREIVMIFPPQGRQKEPAVRTSLTAMSAEQRSLYDALDLSRYSAS